ncbi:MAG: hypothetical protein RB191_04795 [Terriglobia bacterium]|nr:hypothetical protein [Terriglobia bacterium]
MSETVIWTVALIALIPFLVWINLRRWRSGEISSASGNGWVVERILRARQPIKYWTILVANVTLIVALTAWVIWNIVDAIR